MLPAPTPPPPPPVVNNKLPLSRNCSIIFYIVMYIDYIFESYASQACFHIMLLYTKKGVPELRGPALGRMSAIDKIYA